MKHLHLPIPRSDRDSRHRAVPAASLRLRVRVRLGRHRLDHGLAVGFPPEVFDDLSLRAAQLSELPTRRRVAESLRRLVRHAELPAAARLGSAVPVCRRSVLTWREGLLGLAERLDDPDPVNPCGVARALVLLTDGASPLYNPHEAPGMGPAVWWVADGLQPRPYQDA